MQNVYIDKQWVVDKYLLMKKTKAWGDLESKDDLRMLALEQELYAEILGVNEATLPPNVCDDTDDWEEDNPFT
jgi:hypothetical protein